MKTPTTSVSNLAARAGVSPATVSIVLNDHPLAKRVAAKTREKILALAKEMNYRPNYIARAMRKQSTRTIAFICGRLNSPFYAELADDLAIVAEERGYHLLVQTTSWDAEKELNALEMIASRMVDGIVLISGIFPSQADKVKAICPPGVPLVVLDQRDEKEISTVSFDLEPGMEELFQCMIDRGFRQIAMADDRRFQPKKTAYLNVCNRFSVTPEFFDFVYWDSESIRQCARQIIPRRPEALVVASDYIAAHLVSLFGRAGIRVPQDISIASIDGTRWSELYNPPLTAICQDTRKMAQAAIEEILRCRENKDVQARSIVIPTGLRLLDSVGSKA